LKWQGPNISNVLDATRSGKFSSWLLITQTCSLTTVLSTAIGSAASERVAIAISDIVVLTLWCRPAYRKYVGGLQCSLAGVMPRMYQGGVGVELRCCFWSGCWAPPGLKALGVSAGGGGAVGLRQSGSLGCCVWPSSRFCPPCNQQKMPLMLTGRSRCAAASFAMHPALACCAADCECGSQHAAVCVKHCLQETYTADAQHNAAYAELYCIVHAQCATWWTFVLCCLAGLAVEFETIDSVLSW
jgi:hypothetical protein